MEQTVEISQTTGKGNLNKYVGVWKLTYKPINTLGADAFGGLTLGVYKNPKTLQDLPRMNPNGLALSYLMISKLNTLLHPDEDAQDRLDVEWLIHHPEVIVEGYTDLPEVYKKAKRSNAQLTLTALDFQEQTEIEEEDFIDKLISKIVVDKGPQALSMKKIKYILAELDKAYIDTRFISNPAVEKKALKSSLKTYVKKSYDNAKKVSAILDHIETAKTTYELKEMIRLRIITESNGMFKYQNIPLGVSIIGVISAWEKEPELKMSMIRELNSKLK